MRSLRAALLSAAPDTVASPRIVVMSPGPFSETAFDQAFLAGALGFPLVQGSDLVVRDGWVWLKPAGWPRTASAIALASAWVQTRSAFFSASSASFLWAGLNHLPAYSPAWAAKVAWISQ